MTEVLNFDGLKRCVIAAVAITGMGTSLVTSAIAQDVTPSSSEIGSMSQYRTYQSLFAPFFTYGDGTEAGSIGISNSTGPSGSGTGYETLFDPLFTANYVVGLKGQTSAFVGAGSSFGLYLTNSSDVPWDFFFRAGNSNDDAHTTSILSRLLQPGETSFFDVSFSDLAKLPDWNGYLTDFYIGVGAAMNSAMGNLYASGGDPVYTASYTVSNSLSVLAAPGPIAGSGLGGVALAGGAALLFARRRKNSSKAA